MEEQETIVDIIADMCGGPIPQHRHDRELLRYFADRLEAALKREKAAIEVDALAVGGMVEASRATAEKSSVVGGTAKMREALQQAKVAILAARKKMGVDNPIILEIIDAALAEPVRNCEVGTAEEQTTRFAEFCKSHIHSDLPRCAGCPLEDIPDGTGCAQAWAQLPYEEGGAK